MACCILRFFIFLITSVLLINSIECLNCKEWKRYGFRSKDDCMNRYKGLVNSKYSRRGLVDLIKKPFQIIGNFKNKITDKIIEKAMDVLMKPTRLRYSNSKHSKHFKLSDIHKEAGFDLTKEEMMKFKVWEKGVIPYFIDEYSFDKVLRDRIRTILDQVNAATNLEFVEIPRPPDDEKTRYVFFINRRGLLPCVDHTTADFTNEGIQRVILGYDCIDLQNGMAGLIMILLGIPPQHNAPNRDHYIEIVEENILPDKTGYFKALTNQDWLFHDIKYDIESATHYPNHKYTAQGGTTIRPKYHMIGNGPMGESKSFSRSDLQKIAMLYNFISRSRKNDVKTQVCSKMFKPGKISKNNKSYQDYRNLKAPRKRPAKYLQNDGDTQDDSPIIDNSKGIDEIENENDNFGIETLARPGSVDKFDYNEDKGGEELIPVKLNDKTKPLSEDAQKRYNLKHILQNMSDFKTEERK